MYKSLLLLMLLFPTILFAEVSDKLPPIDQILSQGITIATAVFLAGYFRWWLGVLCLAIFAFSVMGTISLWNETALREALLLEQGWGYFGTLVFRDILLGVATIIGSLLSYNRRLSDKEIS